MSKYFEDDDAFQEMLTTEDDLIDAYARGDLVGEERRRFEQSFVSSLHGNDRVQFARAFAGAVSTTRSAKTRHRASWQDSFNTLQSSGLLWTATIAAVIFFIVVLAWIIIDRRRMTNEIGGLRAESAELSKRVEALQQSSVNEQTRTTEIASQLADLSTKPTQPERAAIATQQATPESVSVEPFNTYTVRNVRGTAKDPNSNVVSGATETLTNESVNVTSAAEPAINTSDATLGNSFESKRITELPLNVNNVVGLLSLQPGVSRSGYVNGGRSDQSKITVDGIDVYDPTPTPLSSIRFQIALETAATHDDYRVIIKTADGRLVTSVEWIEPFTPDQTIIESPAISTVDLPTGDYVLLLMGKEPDGSFVKVAEYSFKVIRNSQLP